MYEPVPENGECPEGYARIGCCKCVLSGHADSQHLMREHIDPEPELFKIHGAPKPMLEKKDATTTAEAEQDEPEATTDETSGSDVPKSDDHPD